MENKYDTEDIEEMAELIDVYKVEYDNCGRIDCSKCNYLEDCYFVARQKQDSEWAKSINYGGYDTEEEFWEQI